MIFWGNIVAAAFNTYVATLGASLASINIALAMICIALAFRELRKEGAI